MLSRLVEEFLVFLTPHVDDIADVFAIDRERAVPVSLECVARLEAVQFDVAEPLRRVAAIAISAHEPVLAHAGLTAVVGRKRKGYVIEIGCDFWQPLEDSVVHLDQGGELKFWIVSALPRPAAQAGVALAEFGLLVETDRSVCTIGYGRLAEPPPEFSAGFKFCLRIPAFEALEAWACFLLDLSGKK